MRPICLIDDDEDVRTVMCYALEFEGHRVIPLESGKKALKFLSSLLPDELPSLIVVDYMMPDMDGIEFIKEVRRIFPHTLGKIPMALSTARNDFDDDLPEEVEILHKPVDLNYFLTTIKQRSQATSGNSLSV